MEEITSFDALEKAARSILRGVGDPSAGEWVEHAQKRGPAHNLFVVHVQRRCNATEDKVVGPVKDLRGTKEHQRRALLVAQDKRISSIVPYPVMLNEGIETRK